MDTRRIRKSRQPKIQDLTPETYIELTDAEAEKVEGGILIGMLLPAVQKVHNYETFGTLGQEQILPK